MQSFTFVSQAWPRCGQFCSDYDSVGRFLPTPSFLLFFPSRFPQNFAKETACRMQRPAARRFCEPGRTHGRAGGRFESPSWKAPIQGVPTAIREPGLRCGPASESRPPSLTRRGARSNAGASAKAGLGSRPFANGAVSHGPAGCSIPARAPRLGNRGALSRARRPVAVPKAAAHRGQNCPRLGLSEAS